jgi:ATP-binding cassette subfamily B protein
MHSRSPVESVDTENLTRFRGKPFLFLLRVASTHVWVYVVSFIFQLADSLFSLVPTFLSALIAHWLTTGTDPLLIISLGSLIILTSTISGYFGNLYIFMDGVRRPYVARECRRTLLRYTLYNSYDFFARSLSGKIASRINQVGSSINEVIWNFQCVFGIGLLRLIIAGGVLFTIKPIIAVIFILWCVGYYTCAFRQTLRIRQANSHLSGRESTTSGQIVDTLTNFATLFNLGGHEVEIERAMHYVNRETATQWVAVKRELRMTVTRTGWNAFLGISYMIAAGSLSILHQLTLSQIVFLFGLWGYCTDIGWLTWAISNLIWHHARAKEQLDGLLEPYTVLAPKNPVPLDVKKGEIHFDSLTFVYPNGTRIFDNLTLTIPAGEKIGLVGRSGAGKSTFINLLLRLYDPTSGSVLVNGVDIRQVAFEDLRAVTAVVPQDPSLFHRSIIDNVRFVKPNATLAQVQLACRMAHAHDFIEKLPQGYETLVGERGVKLSVGQRQRVAIARAILKDAPIVIFDEDTSALDSESELAIQQAIHTLFAHKTLLVIAHRLSTLREMNRVLVFDNGKVIEDGSPAELLKNGSLYAKLWNLQSEGFLGHLTAPPFVEAQS